MEKEDNFFIVCYDTGIDYHYEFDPENPDNDDPKEYDYVPVIADTMKEALEKAADEMQQHIGKIYPIDFESTMKNNSLPEDWRDIFEYIKENNVDIDISEILNELSKDEDTIVRSAMAGNEIMPVNVLEAWSKDEDYRIREAVAGNENTPAAVLETLARDEDYLVRSAVAYNENTSATVLEALSKDENWEVRSSVAENENTSVNVLEALSKDEDGFVRMSVGQNPNTPVAVLEALAKDEYYHAREAANKRLEKPVISASDLKEAKAEKDVRDAAAPKQEQKQKAQEHGLE